MRKIIFSFILTVIFFCNFLSAQEQVTDKKFKKNKQFYFDKNTINIKSRAINFEKDEFTAKFHSEPKKRRVYIKINQPSTTKITSKLKEAGISLEDYLTDDTYIVEINQSKFNSIKDMPFVIGFAEIDPCR